MRSKLIPLFLLSVSLSFGSVITYTISFYDLDGNPVSDPTSDGFSYDASAPVGSQFTGFDFTWDSEPIDFTGDTVTGPQAFGEAFISGACFQHSWTADSQGPTNPANLFILTCDGPNYLEGGFPPGTVAARDSGQGIYTVCQVGMTCAAPAITPEPGTIWPFPIAAAMTLLSKSFISKTKHFSR